MQKIDFVKNLATIVEKLKSQEIVTQFQAGFSQPGQNYNYSLINPLLFLSKAITTKLRTNQNMKKY